jgi:hypothetical protein
MLFHLIGVEQLRSQRQLVAMNTGGSAAPEGREEPEGPPDDRDVIRLQFSTTACVLART